LSADCTNRSPDEASKSRTGSKPPAANAPAGNTIPNSTGARLAGINTIGYANKPGKFERLTNAGAGAVITSLADLALWLRALPLPD